MKYFVIIISLLFILFFGIILNGKNASAEFTEQISEDKVEQIICNVRKEQQQIRLTLRETNGIMSKIRNDTFK